MEFLSNGIASYVIKIKKEKNINWHALNTQAHDFVNTTENRRTAFNSGSF